MHDQPNSRRTATTAIFAGAIVAILTAGGGAAWWALHNLSSAPPRSPVTETPIEPGKIPVTETPPIAPPHPTTQKPPLAKPHTQPQAPSKARVYWLDPKSERLSLIAHTLTGNPPADPDGALSTALTELLAGAKTNPSQTTIPDGTQLIALHVDKQDIHLNLSQAFTEGGGSTSMVGRLAQVLYTATSLQPNGKLWLDVDGQPLEVLGGEGVEVPQPITRKWFEENFQG
jgi:spore germination protein GerM